MSNEHPLIRLTSCEPMGGLCPGIGDMGTSTLPEVIKILSDAVGRINPTGPRYIMLTENAVKQIVTTMERQL